jgi:hypothetical protein
MHYYEIRFQGNIYDGKSPFFVRSPELILKFLCQNVLGAAALEEIGDNMRLIMIHAAGLPADKTGNLPDGYSCGGIVETQKHKIVFLLPP